MLNWRDPQISVMKVIASIVLAGWSVVCAQPPAAAPAAPNLQLQEIPDSSVIPDSTVIAEFPDHSTFTMGDVRRYFYALPPDNQRMVRLDPRGWIQGWSRMVQLARMAEKEKLDQRSPLKEQLEFQRLLLLAQSEMQDKSMNTTVDSPELTAGYDRNKEKYKQVKVSAIYIAFGEKGLTEEQAKTKAEKVLAQIRHGADFAKLAHENSDDETSKAKDGYFATLSPTDNIPDALRGAVFQLKPGETSEPIRQPNGYYLLRAEEITYKPLSDVRDQIFNDLKNQKLKEWLDGLSKDAEPKFVNPAFPPPPKSPAAK